MYIILILIILVVILSYNRKHNMKPLCPTAPAAPGVKKLCARPACGINGCARVMGDPFSLYLINKHEQLPDHPHP